MEITSLKGISNFRNLTELNCSDNQLTSLNLSRNTKLTQENLKCTGNKYPITIDETERTFDLSTLPAEFDVTKTSEWVGGTVEGNTLKVKPGATQVTYTYDCGNGLTSVFSLQVLTITRIKQVNLRVNTPKKNEMPDETVVILDNGADVCDAKIYWVEGDDVGGKPIIGLILFLQNRLSSFANRTPPTVSKMNATRPRPRIISVCQFRNASAVIFEATVMPSRSVMRLASTF